jgi:hypothetical protein
MHSDVETELLSRLEEYGMRVAGSGELAALRPGDQADLTIAHSKASRQYVVIYLPMMTLTELSRLGALNGTPHPILVVGEHIGERSAAAYREAGVQFLDRAGNAYLKLGAVLVDARGRSAKRGDTSAARARDTNLFSARRAQVIFAILVWRDLVNARLRAIADACGVSIGQVQSTVKLLEETGYLRHAAPRAIQREGELIDRWTAAYPTGLGPKLHTHDFFGDIDHVLPTSDDKPLFIGGESALEGLLRPASLTLYTATFDPRLPAVNRWRTDREPNIHVRRKFWLPPPLLEHPTTYVRDMATVPSLLIYADLMASNDSRQREAARTLREQDAQLRQM